MILDKALDAFSPTEKLIEIAVRVIINRLLILDEAGLENFVTCVKDMRASTSST